MPGSTDAGQSRLSHKTVISDAIALETWEDITPLARPSVDFVGLYPRVGL